MLPVAVTVFVIIFLQADAQGWNKYSSIAKYYNFDKSYKGCHERPLETRELHANVIFTGTIRELEPDWHNMGMQRAMVEIKRVMKGGEVLSRLPLLPVNGMVDHRRVVIVEGIGDPGICHADARKNDTRIFLVSKASNGELRLNSSLIRITIDNIQKAEDAVKTVKDNSIHSHKGHKYNAIVPFKPEHSVNIETHITMDPCKKKSCLFGSECVVNIPTGEASCQCREMCDNTFAPVCGSDGVTYDNECHLRIKSCSMQKYIGVLLHKSCDMRDPCKGKVCSFGASCVASLDGLTARCQCPEKCDSYGDAEGSGHICGSDGRNYENLCEMKKIACEQMKDIEKKYDGKCDPCDGFGCPSSQVCLLDSNRRPVCQCDALCPMIFDPVCGSNGKTYSNECIMVVDACRRRLKIWRLFRGECSSGNNPCHGVSCGPYGQCVVDSSNAAHCECPYSCEQILKPVCGSDGHSYPSECHLQREACIDKKAITVSHSGECNTVSVCTNYQCSHEAARCIVRNHQPVCICPRCSEEYQPVCASNGITYTNECKLKSENCEMKTNVSAVHKGLCDPCENKKCDFYSVCVSDGRNGRCECPQQCKEVEAKVCGSDGFTYSNECELRRHSCQLQELIVIVAYSSCDPCADVQCKYGAQCEKGKCICPNYCPDLDGPVCGSDGETYTSECMMQRNACAQSIEIEASHAGACEDNSGSGGGIIGDCYSQLCRFGGMCKPNRNGELECVCNFNCDAVRSPVCGTDGKTYGNECQMKEESCRKQMEIKVQPMDNCEDIFEELCDGKPALVNAVTGKEFNCNHGSNCPAGSYCHRLGTTGKCCSGDQPTKSCVESKFGCCPDNVTPASGPNNVGCPNSCQCHPLGANSTMCDPITRQCVCKPGVGGLKCDRCNEAFWGLKSAHVNNGCIPCSCNPQGSARNDCDQMTGRCSCRPGITGQKCTICKTGEHINNCTDGMVNDHLTQAAACSDKKCQFGAVCQMVNGIAECNCPSGCGSDDDRATMVCGSDGQTYGSACQLRQFSCRLQKDIAIVNTGACPKYAINMLKMMTSTTKIPVAVMKHRDFENDVNSFNSVNSRNPRTRVRRIKDLTQPIDFGSLGLIQGILGSFCEEDKECLVTGSYCKNGLCACKNFIPSGIDNTECSAERFVIPSFSGQSYLQLKRSTDGSIHIAIELQFQPQQENGILFYAGQDAKGKGDFLSLSLRNGRIEFRYDLGSGAALLKSVEKVKLGMFHKVIAIRSGHNGVLKLDEGHEVSSTSPGMMRSLNLNTPIYLGFVPNMTDLIIKNVGVDVGFVGCIESMTVKSGKLNFVYDLTQDSSTDIEKQHHVRECGISACTSSPCLNGGRCMELDGGINFQCRCSSEYSGVYCEEKLKLACSSNPCQHGGTCLQLDNGRFICNCPASYDGERCEKVFKLQHPMFHPVTVTTPQFHGDSFIVLRLSKTASHSLSFEIWFLPLQPDGLLLYSAHENSVRGDFLSLSLNHGHAQLRYNLGSGIANITSKTKVTPGMWNKVIMSRTNRLGSLSLNDDIPAHGQSGGNKNELNLPMKIYIGGYPNEYHYDSDVKSGFVGAIQKFYREGKLVKNLLSESVEAVHVTQYNGPPCPVGSNPCRNGGTCIPNLNDFECQCVDSFSGITCEIKSENTSVPHPPLEFNGRTHHIYNNIILERQASNNFQMKFKTKSSDGLLFLMMRKTASAEREYLAVAISEGHVMASFNLGKEKSSKPLFISSRLFVSDGQWHNLTFTRFRHSAHLFVDHDQPMTAVVSSLGVSHPDTSGSLWIGGSAAVPTGLPRAFYAGFKGCIEFVKVDNRNLNLVQDREMQTPVSFCDVSV